MTTFHNVSTMDMANGSIEEFSRESLMDDVRQYSCLYDRYCKDYQDKNVKKNAWAAVAAKYAISPEDAEKKYKTIRSSFTRFLKRKRNAVPGSRNADGPTPIAFQNLDWLASHIDHKETSSLKWVATGTKSDGYLNEYSSLDEDDVYHGSYGEIVRNEEAPSNANGVIEVPTSSVGNELVHESVSTERAPSRVVQSAGGPVIERAITMYYDKANPLDSPNSDTVVNLKPVESFRAPFADVPTLKRKRIEHNGNDEDELFCLSLVANLKRLSPRRKAIAKMRFQQVLFDFEFPSSESDKA